MNLFSIPHTGTHLVRDEIIGGTWTNAKQGSAQISEHIYTFNAPLLITRMEQSPTIITVRHPRLTATSWLKYGKDVRELPILYYILVELLDKYEPLYLPIDGKDRDKYLTEINNKLGTDYKTDWPMVSVHNTRKPDLGEHAEDIDRLCKNIKPFLDRFYGNNRTNRRKSPTKAKRS